MAKKNIARSNVGFGIFKNHETDWTFKRTVAYMSVNAAETGEVLWAAGQINEKNIESWISTWAQLAERTEKLGDESARRELHVSAREAYLRACNYWRTAEYGCAPQHPKWDEYWQRSVAAFQKAMPLFDFPIEYLELEFEGMKMPGYFFRPSDDGVKRPTFMIVGGNDSSGEEMALLGFAAVKRGYNFFTFDYPGHRGAVHLDPRCVKMVNYEFPFKVAFDWLEKQPGVDERIALEGFSFGGYVATRVGCYEPRVKALIPDSPIINMNQLASRFFDQLPPLPVWLKRRLINAGLKRSPMKNALLAYSLHTWGIEGDLMDFIKSGVSEPLQLSATELAKISCPVLGLVSEDEGPLLVAQAKEFYRLCGSANKQLRILSLENDGTNEHCQLDNISRGAQVTFDWLDEVL